MNPKILVADKLAAEGPDYLRSRSAEVTVKTGLTGDELIAALAGHDGVVVRSETQITAPVIEKAMSHPASRLKAVARAGVGVDNIDLDAATRFGIAVMNSASASTITTAEHAFALLIALARNIAPAHLTMASGGWDRSKFTGSQLAGKTLGVVGFGRIGQTLAHRALAFGMKVIGYDPLVNADTALDGQVKLVRSFDEMLPLVDVISFHVPKTEQTSNMLSRERMMGGRLRKGALIVNAARGGIIDEAALLESINAGHVGGAALDVFDPEPLAKDSPLRGHPKILLTPHLGASTVEAQEAVAVDACKALLTFLRGEGLDGAVNAGGLRMDLSDRQKLFVDLSRRMIALVCASADQLDLSAVRFTMRGESLAGRADTIARFAMAELLRCNLDEPVTLINAAMIAQQRHIEVTTTIAADKGEDRIAIVLETRSSPDRRSVKAPNLVVEGAIYADDMPRITQLNGYAMDMVPAGHMVLLTNADKPGRIGLVGQLFGDAGVNIAEMVIGRRPRDPATSEQIAMMILKTDGAPPPDLLAKLRRAEGILNVANLNLSATNG